MVNPQRIEGGDGVVVLDGVGNWNLHPVQWVDNELGLMSLRSEGSGYIFKTPLEVKLVQKGMEENKGLDRGEPSLPLNPSGVEVGDLIWTDWGPGVVVEILRGYARLDNEHYIPLRPIHLSAKAGDEKFEQKRAVLEGVWAKLKEVER